MDDVHCVVAAAAAAVVKVGKPTLSARQCCQQSNFPLKETTRLQPTT